MLAMAVFSSVALYTGVSPQGCLFPQGQLKCLSSAETETYLTQVVMGQTALTLAILYRLEKTHRSHLYLLHGLGTLSSLCGPQLPHL